jgi:hypothetical protein
LGFTALFDGVDLGIEEVRRGHNRHKAIVIISDGRDNRGVHTQNQISSWSEKAKSRLMPFGILVRESEMFSQAEVGGPGLLKGYRVKVDDIYFLSMILRPCGPQSPR